MNIISKTQIIYKDNMNDNIALQLQTEFKCKECNKKCNKNHTHSLSCTDCKCATKCLIAHQKCTKNHTHTASCQDSCKLCK